MLCNRLPGTGKASQGVLLIHSLISGGTRRSFDRVSCRSLRSFAHLRSEITLQQYPFVPLWLGVLSSMQSRVP